MEVIQRVLNTIAVTIVTLFILLGNISTNKATQIVAESDPPEKIEIHRLNMTGIDVLKGKLAHDMSMIMSADYTYEGFSMIVMIGLVLLFSMLGTQMFVKKPWINALVMTLGATGLVVCGTMFAQFPNYYFEYISFVFRENSITIDCQTPWLMTILWIFLILTCLNWLFVILSKPKEQESTMV